MLDIAARMWSLVGGDPTTLDHLTLHGPRRVLPSVFDVTGFAAAGVGVATLAAAELWATRSGRGIEPVTVGTREACAAFRCEALFTPLGWQLPPVWDPIAGDYEAADGWIRLHTNYAHHRAAVLRALGLRDAGADRSSVTAAVATLPKAELEASVVDAGGAAAAMYTRDEWRTHPHGRVAASALPIEVATRADTTGPRTLAPAPVGPLDGVKVLDLTRVIAGPFGTRLLAAWGADVLRLDPPGFEEVAAIVPESTAGKRCAFVDLATAGGRAHFLDLVHEADVVVHGFRPGALDGLGLGSDVLRDANPGLVISRHDAYGWSGPWAGRRGFDSLVQMSCGIAAARGADRPRPLPAQALDHATGMLIAAAVCRALTMRVRTGAAADVRGALIGAANLLCELPDPDGMSAGTGVAFGDDDTEPRPTWWGPARAVPIPGRIGDQRPALATEPGPLGRHPA